MIYKLETAMRRLLATFCWIAVLKSERGWARMA